jgi:dihydrofolate synthase/folylpolyglutamate synthase
LPPPAFGGNEQFSNASCALAVVEQLAGVLRTDARQIADGLDHASLPGRFQQIQGQHIWVVDVAHNGEAAVTLAEVLEDFPGRTIAVIGMMDDKPVEAVGLALDNSVDEWIVVDSGHARSFPASELARRLQACVRAPVDCAAGISDGLAAAARSASPTDRILVTGSFHVVGPALTYLSQHA